MGKVLKILGGVLAVLVVVLVGAVVYVMNIDLNDWKPDIQEAAKDATGRDLVIAGPIEFSLGSDTYLKATDISLSNADWGSRDQMVEVGSVELGLKLFSLLGGAPDITILHVDKVRAIVETNAQGVSNTQMGDGGQAGEQDHGGGGGGGLPILRDLRIADVEVVLKDGQAGTEQTFTLAELSLGSNSASDPLKLNLEAAFEQLDLIMAGEIGSLNSMTDSGTPTPVDLVGNLAGIDLAINGQIADAAGAEGIDILTTINSAEIGDLSPIAESFAGQKIPALGPLAINVALRGDADDGLAAEDLSVSLGTAEKLLLTVTGGIADLTHQSGIDLTIGAQSPELGSLSDIAQEYTGQGLPAIGPLDFGAKIAGGMRDGLALQDLALNLGAENTVLIQANGGIADLIEASGADLSFKVVSPDLSVLPNAPALGPVDVSGTAKGDAGEPITLNPLMIKVGQSDIGGTVTFDGTGDVPSIVARLSSTYFNTADVSAGGGDSAPAESGGAGDGKVIPGDPLPFDAMKGINADIEYNAETLVAAVAEMTNAEVKVTLQGGALSVSPLRANIGEGTLDGTISLDGSQATAPLSIKIDGKAMGLDSLLAGAGMRDRIVGPIDLNIDLAGAGNSPRAIAASLNGKLETSLYGSKVLKKAVEEAVGSTVADLLASEGGWIVIDCAVFNYGLTNGLAETKAGYTASGPITVQTEGTANLGTEQLDMKAKPAGGGGLASVPVLIGGTFANPEIVPDPVAIGTGILAGVLTGGLAPALLATIADLPDDHPCQSEVAESQAQMEAESESSSPIPAAPVEALEGAGEAIQEGVGGAIQNLFGN